jgi:hypothetical protein
MVSLRYDMADRQGAYSRDGVVAGNGILPSSVKAGQGAARRGRPRAAAILLALLLVLTGGAAGAGEVQYVIHVSVDGLRADQLQDLILNDISGDYASFRRFLDEGAATFNARTDYTHTITLPNHTSMVTGRPVLQPAGQPDTVHHGYTSNGDPLPGETLHNTGNLNIPYKASAFDVAHDHGLSTAHYASKTKFVLYDWSYDASSGAPDTTGTDDGRDKIDAYVQMSTGWPATAADMNAAFVTAMGSSHFGYSFVHYVDPDAAGHALGWESADWSAAVRNVNGYLEAVFDLIENDPVLDGHTAIILSTDHGGTGFNHFDETDPADHTIPFLVWGPGVAAGADLYAVNAGTRADPGGGRPDYDAAVPPIRNGDGGNLALTLLGLPAIPGSTINADQSLAVATVSSVPTISGRSATALAAILMLGGAALIIRMERRRGPIRTSSSPAADPSRTPPSPAP